MISRDLSSPEIPCFSETLLIEFKIMFLFFSRKISYFYLLKDWFNRTISPNFFGFLYDSDFVM